MKTVSINLILAIHTLHFVRVFFRFHRGYPLSSIFFFLRFVTCEKKPQIDPNLLRTDQHGKHGQDGRLEHPTLNGWI